MQSEFSSKNAFQTLHSSALSLCFLFRQLINGYRVSDSLTALFSDNAIELIEGHHNTEQNKKKHQEYIQKC